jgi:NADP-dependent alcohol dehydrogenase
VDAFAHTLEQYLTCPAGAPLQDRIAEGILRTLIEVGPRTLADPLDYQARANVMWCATMALNGLIGCGVPQDWATHLIGHELTALHGLDHAQTLAIVYPGLMEARRESKREKLVQYAGRVWDVNAGDDDARIREAIGRTRGFFESLGVKTRLAEYGISAETIPVVAGRLERRGWTALGERGEIGPKQVVEILALSA